MQAETKPAKQPNKQKREGKTDKQKKKSKWTYLLNKVTVGY